MSKRVASQSKARQAAAPPSHGETEDQYDEYIYYQYEPKKTADGAYEYVPETDDYDPPNDNGPMQQRT